MRRRAFFPLSPVWSCVCPLIGKEEESDGGRERGCTDGSFFLSVFVPPTSLYASFTLAGKKGGGGARTSVFSTLDPERNKKIGGKSRLCLNRAFPLHIFFEKSVGGKVGHAIGQEWLNQSRPRRRRERGLYLPSLLSNRIW